MNGFWLRARAWAGLADADAPQTPQPVAWPLAVRAWLLVYVVSTLGMASIFWITEELMGGGVHVAAEGFAPLIGAAMFMGAVRSATHPTRSTAATVMAWMTVFVLASIGDLWIHPHSGWARFVVSVGLSTLACGVFVAVTHVQLDRLRTGPMGADRRG